MKGSSNNHLLEVNSLKTYYSIQSSFLKRKKTLKAVDDVSFYINHGETYGLVGESGSGKSTIGRSILQLAKATSGEIRFKGDDLLKAKGRTLKSYRKEVQMMFQDPMSSLDPKKRVGYTIGEPLKIHKKQSKVERKKEVLTLLEKVGFTEEHYTRFPYEFSGGQKQRIGLARALALNPSLVICDEPVSALDVSIQSQVLNVMRELKEQYQLAYLFIAHDLSVVRHISDRIGVMYIGKIVEQAPTDTLFANPLHPYTQGLIESIPVPDPKRIRGKIRISGSPPSPLDEIKGCAYHTRCPFKMAHCETKVPEFVEVEPGHSVRCHLYH